MWIQFISALKGGLVIGFLNPHPFPNNLPENPLEMFKKSSSGLLLGHDFEFAPEVMRKQLRAMARLGDICEPKLGAWRLLHQPEDAEEAG